MSLPSARRSRKRFSHHYLGRPWCEAIELDDGRRFILRPMQPSDAPILRRSFAELTPEEVRLRFMHPIKELTEAHAGRLANIEPGREFALVLAESRPPETALIAAVARAALVPDRDEAEFAIIVGSAVGRKGLGHHMLGKIVEWARKKRLAAIFGHILADNYPMLALARSVGFRLRHLPPDFEVIEARLPLRQSD